MRKKGFTLIELIVVIGLVSLISSVGMVKFEFLGKIRAKNELNILINDMYYAKEKALISGRKCTVYFREDQYMLRFSKVSMMDDMEDIDRDLDYLSLSKNVEPIVFNGTGSLSGAKTVVFSCPQLVGEEGSIKLVIGAVGGSIRIEENKN
ncbi:prepilin-type N-terminal cleavage/methylation domain-containing protein [Anaerococcus sp.]|uniref:pilus assembly FimT family protein n=1 Tax=Anaerococcus sp. TaxID=1872515 RepID=UPI002A758E1D|nr:prepilin-type N-terminal cleavage/methylation domain-containing protein [Anaerococcus sp.]MDY2927931.1 prepilin-type N-terminal cleavage/methylation domain-containing protein [Anaerococcus sp.]